MDVREIENEDVGWTIWFKTDTGVDLLWTR
jgi:hypothetical protein